VPTRAQVLGYRVAVQHLERPAGDGVLAAGVSDNPPGRTAHVALRVRGVPLDPAGSAVVHSMRGAPHLHAVDDLPLLAGALRIEDLGDLARHHFGPFDPGIPFPAALDAVADGMRAVTAGGEQRTKGELSSALNEVVDARLRPWCGTCEAHHVHDALFRYATLQAGLVIVPQDSGPFRYIPLAFTPVDPPEARRELVRRFLRLCGPARPETLAGWLALTPAAARRWLVDVEPVTVDGLRLWLPSEDLDAVRSAEPARETVLLPPYDPYTELANRELLVPDRAQRGAVWRSVANPGVLVVRGEIAGTWRQRRSTATVQPFRKLTAAERRAVGARAAALDMKIEFAG
jgi:hypothetical protein